MDNPNPHGRCTGPCGDKHNMCTFPSTHYRTRIISHHPYESETLPICWFHAKQRETELGWDGHCLPYDDAAPIFNHWAGLPQETPWEVLV